MSRVVRAALTQTRNAYADMPESVTELGRLASRLDDVRAANVDHNAELVRAAAGAGVRIVCLGELFPAPYFALHEDPMWFALAEDAREGPSVATMRSIAREASIVVVAPIYELDARSGKRFNTAVVIDADGAVLGSYRKTHIPHGSNERGSFSEGYYYERSDGGMETRATTIATNAYFPVFCTSVARIGVSTCYDRHFEGSVRSLARNGAELVLSPAVTFGAKSRRLWELEFEVDAARHGVFIGGSNRQGAERPWNVEYFGASHFVGPNGRVAPVESPRPELVIADLDLDELSKPDPSGWSLARDARPDIYSS